jgi:hypothetical protein
MKPEQRLVVLALCWACLLAGYNVGHGDVRGAVNVAFVVLIVWAAWKLTRRETPSDGRVDADAAAPPTLRLVDRPGPYDRESDS